jgi:hypothetical protein
VRAIATDESLSDAIYGSTADGSSDAAPKKAGTIRIAAGWGSAWAGRWG